MRRIKWLVLVGLFAWGVGCKETANILPAGAGAKTATTKPTGKADSIAAKAPETPIDTQPVAPSSPLLHKPITIESGHFDVKQAGQVVMLPGFQIQLPSDWTLQTEVPSPRLANLVTPEGLSFGVFWFGSSGGGVDENLKRWEGQFSSLTSREVSTDTTRSPWVTQARMQGIYAGDNGMNPGRPNETSVMLVAIVQGSRGSVFFKTVGSISQTNAARGLLRASLKEMVAQP